MTEADEKCLQEIANKNNEYVEYLMSAQLDYCKKNERCSTCIMDTVRNCLFEKPINKLRKAIKGINKILRTCKDDKDRQSETA